MSFNGPGNRFLYLAGYDLLSTAEMVKEIDLPERSAVNEDTTGPASVKPTNANVGVIEDSDIQYTAWYSDATLTLLDLIRAISSTARVMCWGYEGSAIGSSYWGTTVLDAKYKKLMPVREFVKSAVTHRVTAGIHAGKQIFAKATNTGATFNTTASSVNNGVIGSAIDITATSEDDPTEITTDGAHGFLTGDIVLIAGDNSTPSLDGSHVVTVTGTTTFTIDVEVTVAGTAGTATRTSTRSGGQAHQQVFALTLGGYTNFLGKIRHSVDNSTWADLATFAVVTAAPAAEAVAVTGSVNRYLSYSGAYNGAGTGQTVTAFAGFSRSGA